MAPEGLQAIGPGHQALTLAMGHVTIFRTLSPGSDLFLEGRRRGTLAGGLE